MYLGKFSWHGFKHNIMSPLSTAGPRRLPEAYLAYLYHIQGPPKAVLAYPYQIQNVYKSCPNSICRWRMDTSMIRQGLMTYCIFG